MGTSSGARVASEQAAGLIEASPFQAPEYVDVFDSVRREGFLDQVPHSAFETPISPAGAVVRVPVTRERLVPAVGDPGCAGPHAH
jgi:hypothetical protein